VTTTHGAAAALARAAYASGLAPSVFNTQPWRWRVHPEWLDLYADRSRQLGVADPAGRLLTISCGAALHHARLALAAEGWRGAVRRCPDPDEPDHLARIGPVEYVGSTPQALRRFQAAERRRTDRRPVTGTPVPRELVAGIRAAVEEERAHLHVLPADQVSDLATAATHADTLESADEALRAELRYWVGGERVAGTGVPDTAIPTYPPAGPVPHRDLGSSGTLATGPEADRAATYVVIFGEQDTADGWLCAGQALSAAWLTATEQGVTVLPFSAPMEVPATRTILRRLLAGIGHPYLVLRLGMSDPHHPGPPHTPRLEPTQVVEIVEPGR
jgi:hypothetical protein